MALHKSTQVKNRLPIPSASGANDLVPIFGDFTIPAGFASGDVVEFGGLPLNYVPVDLIVDHEDLGGTMTANFGLLSGEYDSNDGARTCGAQFISASDLSTAAGIKRMSAAGGGRLAPATEASVIAGGAKTRGWGAVFSTVTTPTVGAKVRATLLVRPAAEGV